MLHGSSLKLCLFIWVRKRYLGYLNTGCSITSFLKIQFHVESLLSWWCILLKSWAGDYFYGHQYSFQAKNKLLNPFKYKYWKLFLSPVLIWIVTRRWRFYFRDTECICFHYYAKMAGYKSLAENPCVYTCLCAMLTYGTLVWNWLWW